MRGLLVRSVGSATGSRVCPATGVTRAAVCKQVCPDVPTVTTAGCIVLKPGQRRPGQGVEEVLVVWTGDYPDPTLPKGKVEPGESLEQCAVREVLEETGCRVRIIGPEPVVVEVVLDRHPPVVRRVVHFFEAEPVDGGSGEPGKKGLSPPGPGRVDGSPRRPVETNALHTRPGWLEVGEALKVMLRCEERHALESIVARPRSLATDQVVSQESASMGSKKEESIA